MKHNERCENANSKGRCQCHCGGAMHGINREHESGENFDRTITERRGGEIEQTIKDLHGKVFTCSCKQKITVNGWLGYPHEGGLADKDGKKWWLFVECPKCEYDWSWNKIPIEIERTRITKEQDEKMKQMKKEKTDVKS